MLSCFIYSVIDKIKQRRFKEINSKMHIFGEKRITKLCFKLLNDSNKYVFLVNFSHKQVNSRASLTVSFLTDSKDFPLNQQHENIDDDDNYNDINAPQTDQRRLENIQRY